jgi:hypothetical protein
MTTGDLIADVLLIAAAAAAVIVALAGPFAF